MLRIVVCVKAVPDPKRESDVKIDPATRKILRGDVPLVLNPLDRNALEAALQLSESNKGFISVISMGPPAAKSIIKECLALGADEGILLCDPPFAGADAYATAYTLAKGIQKISSFDVILCGMASSDGSTEMVGPELAVQLGIPVVTRVSELIDSSGMNWVVKADFEDEFRKYRVKLPALFTVTKELNSPRTLSLSGVMRAQKKEIKEWGTKELDISEGLVGLRGSPTDVNRIMKTNQEREVEILSGTRTEIAEKLIQKLDRAGVI